MQSPSKPSSKIQLKTKTQLKFEKSKIDDAMDDVLEKLMDLPQLETKKQASPSKKSIPSPKKKNPDEDIILEPQTKPVPSAPPSHQPEVTVGRSGRVRKAKIVFDPSDEPKALKRKSSTNTITTTLPPTAIENEPKVKPQLEQSDEVVKQDNERKSFVPPAVSDIELKPSMVSKRRKTIATFENEYNGCIECGRSDIKKGRFVNCMDCDSRGHFTCLRNAKYISNSDEEKKWQCPVCQTCAVCYESSVIDKLYKCNTCLNSYHAHCQTEKIPITSKRRFKCESCQGLQKATIIKRRKSVAPNNNKTPSSDGFAGFSEEETANKAARTANPTSNTTKTTIIVKNKVKPLDLVNELERQNSNNNNNRNKTNRNNGIQQDTEERSQKEIVEINSEPHTPTSKLEHIFNESDSNLFLSEDSPPNAVLRETSNEDLYVELPLANKVEGEKKMKQEKFVYNAQMRIKPHESIPDVKTWDCDEVYTYFLGTKTAEYAHLFKDKGIDGDALMLLKRDDILKQFNLKLGAALRLYSHIVSLQYKNNNPILAWEEI